MLFSHAGRVLTSAGTILVAATVLLSACTFAPTPGFAQQPDNANADDRPEHPTRPTGEIREDLKAFAKNSKQTEDYNLQVGSVVDLCRLHHEIVTDPRFGTNSRLRSFRVIASERLRKYARYVELEVGRREKEQARETRAQTRSENAEPESGDNGPDQEDDGQNGQGDLPLNDTQNNAEEQSNASNEPPSESDIAVAESMNESMFSTGTIAGGPVQVFGYLGGNYAPPWDHGDELVALIQDTINPDFWRSGGGEGVIHYYRPSRVLVISASWEVQDRVEDFLDILKYSSR